MNIELSHKPRDRNTRVILSFVCFVVIPLLLLSALVTLLRWRALRAKSDAEAMRASVSKLVPSRAGLADVREFVDKYGAAQDYYEGNCNEQMCRVSTTITSFPFGRSRVNDWKLLRILGIRPVEYSAMIEATNGTVTGTKFGVFYELPDGYFQEGKTIVVTKFAPQDRCSYASVLRHSNYAAGTGNTDNTESVYGIVTVNASEDEYRRSHLLNLNCVNALRPCSLSDLMPLAYSDAADDHNWEQMHHAEIEKEALSCKQLPPSHARFIP